MSSLNVVKDTVAPPVSSLNVVKDTIAPSKVRSGRGRSKGNTSLSARKESHLPAQDAKKELNTGNGNASRRNGPVSQASAQAVDIQPPTAPVTKKDGGVSQVPSKAENAAKKNPTVIPQAPAKTVQQVTKRSAVQQEVDISRGDTAKPASKKTSAQMSAKAESTANDRKDKAKTTTSRKNFSKDAAQLHTSTEMATKPPPGPVAKGKCKSLSTKDKPLTQSKVSARGDINTETVRPARKVSPANKLSKERSKTVGKALPRDNVAIHSKAAVSSGTNITAPRAMEEAAANVYDDFMDTSGYMRGDSNSPSDTYTIPLKLVDKATSSAAFKKQHNSSLSSVGSNRSQTALADISNACLNRGGQRRVFNLSAIPKKNGKKKSRKTANSSNSTSLNSSINSETELKAIPDSLPLNATQSGHGKPPNNASKQTQSNSGKRQSKRNCVVLKNNQSVRESDSDDDSSWEASPPKQKRSKRAPPATKPKAGHKPAAAAARKGGKSKVILTSARTKNKPYVPQSSFDLTEYDFEQEFSEKSMMDRVGHAKAKHSHSPVSSVFSDLRKKAPSKEGQGSGRGKEGKTAGPLASPLAASCAEKEHAAKADKKKRAIDDLYDPDFSPVAADSETSKRHNKASYRPSLLDAPKRQGSSKNTGPRNEPTMTPRSRTTSGRTGKGYPKRSDPATNFPARALLKEFEEEEEEGESEEERCVSRSIVKSSSTSRKRSSITVNDEETAPVQAKRRKSEVSTSTLPTRGPSNKESGLEGSALPTTTQPRGQGDKRSLEGSIVEFATRSRGQNAKRSLEEGLNVQSTIQPRSQNTERSLEGSTVGPTTQPRGRNAQSTEGDLEDSAHQVSATRSRGHQTKSSATVPRSRSIELAARGEQENSVDIPGVQSGQEAVRKCKPSLEPGHIKLKDSAHKSSLEPAGRSRKLSSVVQWEDSILGSANRSRKRILKEQIPSAPKKQPRRSSGYSSYHSPHQSPEADSDVSIKIIASDNPPHREKGYESPDVSPASSTQLPRPSQVGADEGITKTFAEICQSLVSRSGKKPPVATKEVAAKASPQTTAKKSSKTQPSASHVEGQKRKNIAPASPSLTQISRVRR